MHKITRTEDEAGVLYRIEREDEEDFVFAETKGKYPIRVPPRIQSPIEAVKWIFPKHLCF